MRDCQSGGPPLFHYRNAQMSSRMPLIKPRRGRCASRTGQRRSCPPWLHPPQRKQRDWQTETAFKIGNAAYGALDVMSNTKKKKNNNGLDTWIRQEKMWHLTSFHGISSTEESDPWALGRWQSLRGKRSSMTQSGTCNCITFAEWNNERHYCKTPRRIRPGVTNARALLLAVKN